MHSKNIKQMIHVRDSFAAANSETVRQVGYMAQCLMVTIGGKMTPVLQVTDTDLAYPLKRAMQSAKTELFREKRKLGRAFGQVRKMTHIC